MSLVFIDTKFCDTYFYSIEMYQLMTIYISNNPLYINVINYKKRCLLMVFVLLIKLDVNIIFTVCSLQQLSI